MTLTNYMYIIMIYTYKVSLLIYEYACKKHGMIQSKYFTADVALRFTFITREKVFDFGRIVAVIRQVARCKEQQRWSWLRRQTLHQFRTLKELINPVCYKTFKKIFILKSKCLTLYSLINNYHQVNHQLISSDIHYHKCMVTALLPLETASTSSYG